MAGRAIQEVVSGKSAKLAGASEGAPHIGAIEILAQIHEREKSAEDTRLEIVGKRQTTGGDAREALTMLGDELHDFALAFLRSIAERGLAAHARAAIFHRQSEMQHAQMMLAKSSGHFGFAPLDFASVGHGAPGRRA
jgi:hypothetical protein